MAALVSRSSSQPHLHECHRSSSVFLTTAPHPEQIWLVYLGSTNTTSRPAHAALTESSSVNNPVESRKVVPIRFGSSLVKSYPTVFDTHRAAHWCHLLILKSSTRSCENL
jgi:hypothetical protein